MVIKITPEDKIKFKPRKVQRTLKEKLNVRSDEMNNKCIF